MSSKKAKRAKTQSGGTCCVCKHEIGRESDAQLKCAQCGAVAHLSCTDPYKGNWFNCCALLCHDCSSSCRCCMDMVCKECATTPCMTCNGDICTECFNRKCSDCGLNSCADCSPANPPEGTDPYREMMRCKNCQVRLCPDCKAKHGPCESRELAEGESEDYSGSDASLCLLDERVGTDDTNGFGDDDDDDDSEYGEMPMSGKKSKTREARSCKLESLCVSGFPCFPTPDPTPLTHCECKKYAVCQRCLEGDPGEMGNWEMGHCNGPCKKVFCDENCLNWADDSKCAECGTIDITCETCAGGRDGEALVTGLCWWCDLQKKEIVVAT